MLLIILDLGIFLVLNALIISTIIQQHKQNLRLQIYIEFSISIFDHLDPSHCHTARAVLLDLGG